MPDDDTNLRDVVARANAGDPAAWNDIVARFAPLVWRICRDHRLPADDAKDVSQSVWLSVVEHLSTLRQPAALPGWLATATRRECLRVLRQQRRQAQHEEQTEMDSVAPNHDRVIPDAHLLVAERDAIMRAAFAQLPQRCQTLLYLLTRDPPVSYTDITDRMGMRMGSVGPSRARCLNRLRECPILAAWLRTEPRPARKVVP